MATQSNITTELVKELRDATGISVMQCRKALEEAQGDMNKALAILKKTSSDIASKKADRETKDGRVSVKESDGKVVLVTLHCETDFVSKNADFTTLIDTLSEVALTDGIENMKTKAKEMIDPVIQKTGENISLGECFEISSGILGHYIHNNKMGVVVSLEGGNSELARDIAMHIAAMRPEYMSLSEVPEDIKTTMTEVFQKEIASIDKPEEIKQKMLEGKLSTYFKEKTLTEQAFIKNGDQTVGKLLSENGAKIKEVRKSFI